MKLTSKDFIPKSISILTFLFLILLLILPPEKTLGHIIKVIYIHAALVNLGLLAFTFAGIFGIIFLLKKKDSFIQLSRDIQTFSVIIWVLYSVSSMVVTYLAWDEWIAWDEPRVRASIEVLVMSIAFFFLRLWANQRYLTAILNGTMMVSVWVLVGRAYLVRHPLNPIGESNSILLKIIFLLIFLTFLLIAIQLLRLYRNEKSKK